MAPASHVPFSPPSGARRAARQPRGAQHGVTLIELMVVLAIAAIVLWQAVPNFREFVARNRLDGAAQAMLVSLQIARSEAMRRGEQVTMRLSGAAGSRNWGGGWIAFVDGNRNGELDADEEIVIEQAALTSPLSLFSSSSFDTTVAFSRDGRLTGAGGVFVVCEGGVLTEDGRSRSRAVVVNGAGRARMAARNASEVPLTDSGVVTSCSNP